MQIVEKKITDVIPYENNPRYNDNAVDAVAKSIEEFGFQQPLVLDKDNVIIVGHTRYKASLKLGLETVPCVIADKLSEEQIKAYRLVDNKVGELASWDFEVLETELLSIENLNMMDFGFDEIENIDIDKFFEETQAPKEKKKKTITCPYCGEEIEL